MMMKELIGNIKSVKSQRAFHKVQMLHRHHKFIFIALMEPFQQVRYIQKYKIRLGMAQANANSNRKIWYFVKEGIEVEIISNTNQQVTLKLFIQEWNRTLITTLGYAKCDARDRLELWDNLNQNANSLNHAWLVGGDFNVILNEEEKIDGLPVYPSEYEDFSYCINSCELLEVGFKGSSFTWWNGRAGTDCIFKRLDRIVINNAFQSWLGNVEVEHLSRIGSDHSPLLLSCGEVTKRIFKPFKF